jgi:peptide/nickel transport system substrate-binding protein
MNARGFSRYEFLRLGGTAAAGALVSACSGTPGAPPSSAPPAPPATTAGGGQPGGAVITAITGEPPGLDPCNPWSLGSGLFGLNTLPYDLWVRLGRDLQYHPHLAKAWTHPDPATYVFEIQPGVKYHTGRELVADDVVANYQRISDKSLGCAGYAATNANVESMKAVEKYKFEVGLKVPGLRVYQVPLPVAVDPAYLKANAKPLLLQDEAGTGPWILSKWTPQTSITFKRNPDYWLQPPRLDGFELQIIPDESAATAALQSGRINYLPISRYENFTLLKNEPNIATYSQLGLSYRRININHLRPKLQDPNVLQALRYGINRQQIADTLGYGLGAVSGPLSPASTVYALPEPEVKELQKYDPAAARSFLQKAGFDDKDRRLQLDCLSIANFSNFTDVAQLVQANLKEVGIDLDIRILEVGVWSDARVKQKNYDLSINDHTSGGFTPDYTYYHSGQSEQEWTGGADAELDRLIDASNSEADERKRADLIRQIQRWLIGNVRELYLFTPPVFEAASKRFVGYKPWPGAPDPRVFALEQVAYN